LADVTLVITPAEVFVEYNLIVGNTDSRAPTVSVVNEVGGRQI